MGDIQPPFHAVAVLFMGILGRKDAFPGADGSTIQTNGNASTIPIYGIDGKTLLTENGTGLQIELYAANMITGTNTLTYSIKHALSIIYDTSGILDWYTNNQDNQNNVLWIDNANQKSAFDPCPMGWKVPKNGTWNDYSTTSAPFYIQGSTTSSNSLTASNGRLYNLMTWYPSGGYRYSMSGLLRDVGSSGCYWSSTSDETRARYMDITKSYVNPNHTFYRITGRFVRCVQK